MSAEETLPASTQDQCIPLTGKGMCRQLADIVVLILFRAARPTYYAERDLRMSTYLANAAQACRSQMAHGFLTAAGACSKQVIKVACSAAKDVQPLLQQCNAAASEVPPCFHHPTHAANLAQSLQQLHSWRLAAGVHACAAVISGSTRGNLGRGRQ
eukprot:1150973-Pelagomonas_calceolata.AAC.4